MSTSLDIARPIFHGTKAVVEIRFPNRKKLLLEPGFLNDEDDFTDYLIGLAQEIKYKKQIAEESNPFFKKQLEQRLSMLTGQVGIIYVGADSKVELKEKKDRVEDAIYATKAAYKEGIVPGGGVALLNASVLVKAKNKGEEILLKAIKAPYNTILENANLNANLQSDRKGWGIDVTSGKPVNMIRAGIIDPVLVTKTALKNAVSVVNTIISADCIISNKRLA